MSQWLCTHQDPWPRVKHRYWWCHLVQQHLRTAQFPVRGGELHWTTPANFKSYNNTIISSQFQDNSSKFSIVCRESRQKVEHVGQESVFTHHFGTPLPLPSIPEIRFQQFHTSSWSRRYCQRTKLPDSVKDFPKEYLRNNHFYHL